MTDSSHSSDRQIPTPRTEQAAQFQKSLNQYLGRLVHESLAHMVAPENKLHLRHGRSWGGGIEIEGSSQGTFKLTSADSLLPFEDVVRNDISALRRFLTSVAETISSEMKRNIYATVSAAADSTGNVVSTKAAGSPALAFLEMLRKIEFGVNQKGEVTLPDLHLSPEMGQKMFDDLNSQGPEFRNEVERIKREKTLDALQREQARLAKFQK